MRRILPSDGRAALYQHVNPSAAETPEEEASRVFAQLKELSRPEDDKEEDDKE
jgi:hypothetical protein